jgi:alkanesulfonate monooxygenase SsuD/methylene tetrahydromethanopterin reductase-like flavin-dependent oxidoreductase (luciferase family)
MKFGLLGILQLPRPWQIDSELKLFQQALEQVELADRLGFEYLWQVEHHFLEEYSHSSAGESFLAAASQRTKRMRLSSGITLLPPNYNHPARVAERLAVLDLVSNGRAEFGTGESSTFCELDAFHVSRTEKRAMWRESLVAICRMMVEEPFRGANGKYLQMPPRNVIPKPIQKPHPPVWVACSRQETIVMAARLGLGAVTFGFLSPVDAQKWTHDYYTTLAADSTPITYRVNPNVGFLSMFVCDRDARRAGELAAAWGEFGYGFRHFYTDGVHRPGKTSAIEEGRKIAAREPPQHLADAATLAAYACMGTPDHLRKVLLEYESAGVDQVIFMHQMGGLQHDDICSGLELFGKTVLPEFLERDEKAMREKARRLEPVIEKAMKARIVPPAPPYDENYAFRADGKQIRHFAHEPEPVSPADGAKNQD